MKPSPLIYEERLDGCVSMETAFAKVSYNKAATVAL